MKLKVRSLTFVSLLVILVLAAFLRFYKLDTIPASLNWDEVDAGYNAYTIATWGRDEWGKNFPLVFTSFLDDKHPVHIYAAAISIKILGLNDFATRLPGAIAGVFSVLVIYLLTKQLFKSELAGLFAALFLAVSPSHMHFSRGLWEIDFAVLFFMAGLWLFYSALDDKKWRLPLSLICFGLSFFSYHASKVVVPPVVFLLFILYFKRIGKMSYPLLVSAVVIVVIISLVLLNPKILGFARAEQTGYNIDRLKQTELYQKTSIPQLGLLNIAAENYLKHFNYNYLFVSGDQTPRNSVKTFGEFYLIDALLMLAGLLALLLKRSKVTLVILAWVLFASVPSSLAGSVNAHRGGFIMGSVQVLAAVGATFLITKFPKRLQIVPLVAIIGALMFMAYGYINYYFTIYPKKEFIDWQYGMKQIVEYVEEHDGYTKVYMTDVRSQPYIFFLYYLKYPLPDLLKTVSYNHAEKSWRYNLVSSFDRYHFGDWNYIDSPPDMGNLYIVTDSQYDGLKYKSVFDVKKVIKYPDGGDAFYIVSYP